MTSQLDNLAGPGKPLRKEAPDPDEYAGLIRSGKFDLLTQRTRASRSRAASISPTMPRTRSLSLPCDALATVPPIATLSFRCCPIRSGSGPRYGGYSRSVMTCEIGVSTRESWTWMDGWWLT